MSPENLDNLNLFARNPRTYMRISKTNAKTHAKNLDKQLGYRIPKIEVKLLKKYRAYYQVNDESNKKQHFQGAQTWIGLHPQALQTPYNDIFEALYVLKDFYIDNIVDIGAGYGRVGLVMNSLFPDAIFTGYEILKERQQEGNRIFEQLGMNNCKIELKNVLEQDFILPHAQIYFIYDFSELHDISKIMDVLLERFGKEKFFIITKGERVDILFKQKYSKFWIENGSLNSDELSIYSSHYNLRQFKNGELY